jgi:excisionase family DNA binding protein
MVETWLTKHFYTVPETAELLGVHPETVRRNIRSGRIKAFKVGGGAGPWRITAKEIERLIQRGA